MKTESEFTTGMREVAPGPGEATERAAVARKDPIYLAVCLAAVAVSFLLAWPVADLTFGDDVAYSHMALRLSQTGRLTFNGWEAAMNLEQVFWGALVIKVFGFSPLYLRLSTVPLALGAIALCYALSRRAGLTEYGAALVTLTVGLSPVFLPFALSYLTDVPGLFFFLASLYALIRASDSCAGGKWHWWLIAGTVAGLIGGTCRQVVWFVPLLVLLYWVWVGRKNVRFAAVCLMLWVLTVVGVAAATLWFNRQSYVVPLPSLLSELRMAISHPLAEVGLIVRMLLTLLLLCLPAALPCVVRSASDTWNGSLVRKLIVGALLLTVAGLVLIHPSLASIPWISNTLNWQGLFGDDPLHGRPIVLTTPIRRVVALAVYVAACILAGEIVAVPKTARRLWRVLVNPTRKEFVMCSMLLLSVVYFGVMTVRAIEFPVFDRYFLPVMPCISLAFLLEFIRRPDDTRTQRRIMRYAWGVLLILAFYAIANTEDYWALARARVAATRKLEAGGIPRTAIDAGMEYNYWTQLQINGQLNWHWVKNPPGAYRAGLGVTPEVVPTYRLEYAPVPNETVPTDFGSVPYFSLFPPFQKRVFIDRIVTH